MGSTPRGGRGNFHVCAFSSVYGFNALADGKWTLPKTRCSTLLLTSCYLDRVGGVGGDDTFLSDASEVGSSAHQLMVSVRFYWILIFGHELVVSVRFYWIVFFWS